MALLEEDSAFSELLDLESLDPSLLLRMTSFAELLDVTELLDFTLLLDTLVSLSLDPSTSLRVTFCGVTGEELLESEEHAKQTALAAETITRGAANFLSIL